MPDGAFAAITRGILFVARLLFMDVLLNRSEFEAVYQEHILDREFVEYKDYYLQSRERYWRSLNAYAKFGPTTPGTRILDIGGGQMGILAKHLFGAEAMAADAVLRAEEDVSHAGLPMVRLNLMDETYDLKTTFDAIIMCEVIEHIPMPPYIVIEKLARLLERSGILFMTTPNGFRIRNVLYMLANKEVLGIYRYPEENEVLGHQHEYTAHQMTWQVERAGMSVCAMDFVDPGWTGSSRGARLAHVLTKPFNLWPHLRSHLFISAQKSA